MTAMPDNVYAVSEIVGSSKDGVDDAIRGAIDRASRTVRGLDWFEVVDIRGQIADDALCHVQVTMKVGFRLEEPFANKLESNKEDLGTGTVPEMTPGASLT